MFSQHRSFLRVFLALILGFAAHQPARAQLDPRLQSCKTDFLELYQASTNLKAKPEILTIFDFSGSMDALMFHPLYINNDVSDTGASGNLKFTLYNAGTTSAYVSTSITGTTVGTLTSKKLVKPDGSLVTSADVTAGASDVRNWVRAASHVRFAATVGGVTRTVDIPIPWKITDRNSTGSPLTSQKVLDQVVKNGVTYGSGNYIEMDQSYSNSLTGTSTSATLSTVDYKQAYVGWLFTGKYANGSYTGMYIVYDAANASLAGGQGNVSWGQGYGPAASEAWGTSIQVPQYNYDGSYKGEAAKDASANMVPALTRVQATKRAAIQTWIQYQTEVLWAFRFLDPNNEAASGSATTINNNCATTTGNSGWKLLNGSSLTNMNYIAARATSGSTSLTYAMARSLAQYADPSCIFNTIETGTDAPSQCMNHFIILFTDGIDNNGTGTVNNTNGTSPYLVTDSATGKVTISAVAGNRAIISNPTLINRSGTNWNLFTFAGIGAHMADSSLGSVNVDYKAAVTLASGTSGTPSAFLPYAIKQRNGVDFQNDHRVTTMTVGVSLGGRYSDTSSPKRNLFLGAALGDPALTSVNDLASLTPFEWIPDPSDPGSFPEVGRKKPNTLYFFDATDPDALTTSLGYAIKSALGASNINATANPNLPFVGASLGKQIYVGKFQPPKTGGAVWPGDLLMFGTREVNGQTQIIGKSGDVASVLDASTAIWSVSDALRTARPWSSRRLYTRLPSASASESPLKVFTDTGTDYSDAATGLKNYVAKSLTAGSSSQQTVIQFAAGGDTIKGPFDANGRPTANRSNIMGDIIDSAPAAVEYNWNDVQGKLGGYSRLSAVASAGGNRFRLILVGTNQGWLHAFGEVTRSTTVTDSGGTTQKIVLGDVEELWSFMPTDFLANLDYITVPNNPHRFMVDGSPSIYHLDLPPTTGGSGNGVVDATERAIAVFGLRKGGRSYYALDIHDPFNPTMKWSLVPDEADNFPTGRLVSGGPALSEVKTLLKKWGFSSSTPSIGRVQFNGVLHDAVFLGGGFSVPEVEANFPDASAKPTPLGRSVMALDVYSGAVLAAVDLTSSSIGGSTVGPVSAGVIPFEFVLGSGLAQRAYFLDYKGGLWAWGSKQVSSTAPYVDFRMDTSEITGWSIRKVYQDDNNAASGLGGRYTTLPAPFRVGNFPGVGKPGSSAPAAVGVAMVSGDRNNPLDFKYDASTNPAPSHHRLTVVFDRQDSRAWGLDTGSGPDTGIRDTNLMDFTANKVNSTPANYCSDAVFQYITPGCPSYYLAPYSGTTPLTPKFGYYINFPSISSGFIPKGINPPIVVAGTLFYSYFKPSAADPCTGGAGNTYSWLITDAKNPIVEDTRSGLAIASGLKDTWAGVASDYFTVGTRAVIQAGSVSVNNPQPGASLTTPEAHTTQGNPSQKYPKPRVWRTVH